MKLYEVDVRALSSGEKEKMREQLNCFAFFVTDVLSSSEGVVAFRVYWTSKEDFFSSPVFPSNCSCREVYS